MIFRFKPVAALVLSVGLGSVAYGQTSMGTLAGVVRDSTGAALPHATVTIHGEQTGINRTVTAAGDGAYRFDALPPERYTVMGTEEGFSKFTAQHVVVNPSVVTSYDLALSVGSTSSTVNVEADQASVNTENGQLAGVVNAVEIDKLPVFSLNPVELALTVPGVQPVMNGGNSSNGENIQVNGARPRSNNFLLDGQEINDVSITGQAFQPQIPDMFDSVTVLTNSASAEYGRAGGGVVNMVTKQGTNTFHGTLFERYTGSGLDSLPGNLRGSGLSNPRQDEHSYGFTAGGPIIRNKLFAFGAWELQRTYGTEEAGVNLLPDAAGYATLQTITGPAQAQVATFDSYLSNGAYLNTDSQFGNANGSPVVTSQNVGALPGCPASGCVITFAGFQRPNQPLSSPDTQWTYRIDYTPWDKDHFSFRYLHDRSSLTPDFFTNGNALSGFDTYQGGPSELGEGMWTHVFGSHLLNEFRVSEARIDFLFAPTAQTAANPLNSLPTLSFAKLTGNYAGGSITFPNLGPNQNYPQGRKEDLYQFQDTVRYTRGRHSVSLGADIGRLLEIDVVSQNALGTVNFVAGGSGVSSLGNFLQNQTGPSGTVTKAFGPTRADSHGWRNGFFAEDDIKVSADLTLNLGIRYDYLSNPENSLKYPGVDPSNPFAPIPTYVPIKKDWNNVGPRIGFAYSPHGYLGFLGDGKTSIRGGFGVFYDSTFSNILVNSAQSAPVASSGLLQQTAAIAPNGLSNPSSLIPTISPQVNQKSTVESEDSNLVNPLTYQYNLGVERELPGAIVLGIRYVGNRGEKLFANQQYNVISGLTGLRQDPNRGAIILRGNYAASNYNGLEISAKHDFRHGLTINTNYVYSKDLSNGDDIFSGVGSPTSYGVDLYPGNRFREWSNSAFDHRQFFSIAYVYQPAGLHASSRLADGALGLLTRHWTLSGVTQLQSGGYQTINTSGLDINGDGSTTNDRPIVGNPSAPLTTVGIDGIYLNPVVDANGNPIIQPTPGVYYNLALNNTLAPTDPNSLTPVTASQVHFLVPYGPANQYVGQAIGRNSYMTPGTTSNEFALEKGFGLAYLHLERGTFILRAEAQNVFNHNDRTVGDEDVLDAGTSYLQSGIASTQRVLVLWGKLQF